MSGDIGMPNDSLDNADHVFAFSGANGNVLLDGFHVTEGYAHNAQERSKGAGIYYSTGGGLNGKPYIQNCRIYNNSALGGGGYPNHFGYGAGMYIADYDTGDPDMYVTNCLFENNRALDSGGGLYIDSHSFSPVDTGIAVVHLKGCTFIDNSSTARGGALVAEAIQGGEIKLRIDSSTFDGNSLTWFQGDGAAMYFDLFASSGGTLDLIVSNSTFSNQVANSNSEGGAIYYDGLAAYSQSVFNNVTFSGNSANAGGSITSNLSGASSISELEFNSCLFLNNSASSGGALQLNSVSQAMTTTTFNQCTFDANSAISRGGVMHFNADGGGHFVTHIDSCEFTNNVAGENAVFRYFIRRQGAVYNAAGTGDLTILNSNFNNNMSTLSGGVLGLWSQEGRIDALVLNSEFTNNVGGTLGGAVAHTHVPSDSSYINAIYADCTFNQNSVSLGNGNFGGGAMYFDRSNISVLNSTFMGNEGKLGGAIYLYTDFKPYTYTHIFDNCQFIGNMGADHGGAMYFNHDDPSNMIVSLNNCMFDSNYTTSVTQGHGGAIYLSGRGRSEALIMGSTFIDNHASVKGGAFYLGRSTGMTDTLFVEVDSCTFTNNDAGATGRSIEQWATGNGGVKIYSHWKNCDIYNDENDLMFLTVETGLGVSMVTMENCNFYLMPGPPPMPFQPAPHPYFVNDR